MRRESIILLSIVLALVLVGIFIVYSASAVNPDSFGRLQRQLVYAGIGLLTLFVMAHFDYHRLGDPLLFRSIVLFAFLLLGLVLIPGIGVVRGGAQRWIAIGSFTFQPSEFAKFAVILLLAVKLSSNQEHISSLTRGFVPPILIASLFALLILFERDLGTPVIIAAVALAMLFLAGARWRHLLPSVAPVAGLIYLLSITSPYRLRRLMAFLDPWSHSDTEGYQLIQSMTAFAQGSVWGRGPGAGEQKLFYLPAAHTDFIFAVWAEEMGLVGTVSLVLLFMALLAVSLRIAFAAPDLFGTLLAGGIVALVGIQAAVNMAITTGLLPTKGLPLPFISWGGSSLIVFMGLMGILLSIGLRSVESERNGQGAPA